MFSTSGLFYSHYVLIEFCLSFILVVAALYSAWVLRKDRKNITGSVLLAASALWIAAHAFEINTNVFAVKDTLNNLQLAFCAIVASSWFIYVRQSRGFSVSANKLSILIGFFPILAFALIMTDNAHGLLYSSAQLNTENSFLPLVTNKGLVGLFIILSSYALLITGTVQLVKNISGSRHVHQRQFRNIIVAAALVLMIGIPDSLDVEHTFNIWFALTPIAIGVVSLIVIWNVNKLRSVDMLPLANDYALAHINEAVIVLDSENRIVFLNPVAESVAKTKIKHARNRPFEQIFTGWTIELDANKTDRQIHAVDVLDDGARKTYEVSASQVLDFKKEVACTILIVRDVTIAREVEAELKSKSLLINQIVSTIPNAVLVMNGDRTISLANRAFYEGFKMESTEVEGKPMDQVIPIKGLSKLITKTLSDQSSELNHEFRHQVNGHDRVLVATLLPMQKEETLLILNDVTEEREKQGKLYLTDRLASVGEMAAGIAHELNNPLTSVVALSELLRDEGVSEDSKEDIEAICSEAQRAASVVKSMLAFSRKHIPERQPTQINNVLEEVLKLRTHEHRVNNIQVDARFDCELPEVMVDYFQVQQVFLNIVLNAESAMTKAHGHGTLSIATKRVNGNITISISDDGPGIAQENVSRLFDPFFTTKEVGEGTGLGLSISYGIISEHGGKISAVSELDKGATFMVELPVGKW